MTRHPSAEGRLGGFYGAFTVPTAAPWQPNNGVGGTNWISAWQSASAANGVGDYNGLTHAGHRYTYTFRQDFVSAAAGGMQFTAGWDNLFESITLNGTTWTPTSLLVTTPDRPLGNYFGFCRDGDAIHDSADMPNCTATFQANGVVAGNNWMEIVLRGDGTTDGLWIEGSLPSVTAEVAPEPATMALLATACRPPAAIRGARSRLSVLSPFGRRSDRSDSDRNVGATSIEPPQAHSHPRPHRHDHRPDHRHLPSPSPNAHPHRPSRSLNRFHHHPLGPRASTCHLGKPAPCRMPEPRHHSRLRVMVCSSPPLTIAHRRRAQGPDLSGSLSPVASRPGGGLIATRAHG